MKKIYRFVFAAALVLLFAGVFAGAAAAVVLPGDAGSAGVRDVISPGIIGDSISIKLAEAHIEIAEGAELAEAHIEGAEGAELAEAHIEGAEGAEEVVTEGSNTVPAVNQGRHLRFAPYVMHAELVLAAEAPDLVVRSYEIEADKDVTRVFSAGVSVNKALPAREALIARLEAEHPFVGKTARDFAFAGVRGISHPIDEVEYVYPPVQATAVMSNGPNVSGVVGSAVAPGVLLQLFE